MERLTPDAFQEEVIRGLLEDESGGALIAALPGAGKTLVATEYVIRSGVKTVLVIAPLSTRIGWMRTFARQGSDLPFRVLDKDGHENYLALVKGEPGVYFIGQDFLVAATKATIRRPKWDWAKVSKVLDVAVYDEVHGIQNRRSVRFRHIKKLRPRVKRIGMSGTPSGNKFAGYWAVCRWIWPNVIPLGFWEWLRTWGNVETVYVSAGSPVEVPADEERDPGAFVASLPAYYYWGSDAEVNDLRREPKVLYVDMTPKQRKIYSSMEEEAVSWIEQGMPIIAPGILAKRTRLRQIALGVPTVEWLPQPDGEDEMVVTFSPDCASPKIDALLEFAEDHDEPMLVLMDSAKFARVTSYRMARKFPKEHVGLWTGGMKPAERDQILDDFRSGRMKYLVATIAAIGTGTDGLQDSCRTLVWMNKAGDPLLNEQAEGRLVRRGQTRPVIQVEIRSVESEDDPDNSRLQRAIARRMASMGEENVNGG